MTYDPFDPFDPFNALVAETPPEVLAAGQEWVQKQFYEDDTMYHDMFLKFTDQAEADSVLFDGEGEERRGRYAAIDVIGTIYKPTGKVLPAPDGSGEAVDEMAQLEGWHVNVRHTAEAPELDAYRVTPQNPVRMWA